MQAMLALLALGLLLIVALIFFCNELYYRRRISACGTIVFVCAGFLVFHVSDQTTQIRELTVALAKFVPVKVPKGE